LKFGVRLADDKARAARSGRGHSDRRPRRGAYATNNDCTGDPRPGAGRRPYASRVGTFTPRSGHGVGYDLTLIEAEVLDELTLADGNRMGYAEARPNIVTRGIDLNALVGQRFRIGDVECVGRRLCEPCAPTWSDSPTKVCCAD
jgi:hypothetical protein